MAESWLFLWWSRSVKIFATKAWRSWNRHLYLWRNRKRHGWPGRSFESRAFSLTKPGNGGWNLRIIQLTTKAKTHGTSYWSFSFWASWKWPTGLQGGYNVKTLNFSSPSGQWRLQLAENRQPANWYGRKLRSLRSKYKPAYWKRQCVA